MRSALRLVFRLHLLACLLIASIPAAAQPSESAVADWEALNQRMVEAYRTGDYRSGLEWARKAYELAEREFGRGRSEPASCL